MKKIVALALCLVLALSLCATAFAANLSGLYDLEAAEEQDSYLATSTQIAKTAAKATTKTVDGYVEHYNVAATATDFVKVTDPEDATYVVYKAGKTAVEFYLMAVDTVNYTKTGVALVNFGDKCEQISSDYDTDKFYTVTDIKTGNTSIMVKANGGEAVLVGGELVKMVALGNQQNGHSFEPETYKADGVTPVTYKCSECGKIATVFANRATVPTGALVDEAIRAYYMPNAVAGTTTAVSSAKTFDAGIALYVGMSISAVAGSAVVIGKKKEF